MECCPSPKYVVIYGPDLATYKSKKTSGKWPRVKKNPFQNRLLLNSL